MILEDAAVPRIRENAEPCIRQRLKERDRIDGRHHDVIVAVGDENGMADRAQLFCAVAFAPLNDCGALRLRRLVAGSRIAIVLARLQARKKCVGGRLARLGLREEQEVLGMFLLGGRILEGALQDGIASYCILQLLAAGYQVGTTVRSLKRESNVRAMLRQGGAEPGDRLKFFAAELEQDAGWREAATGCDYVLHVASPLSQHVPKNEDEMIVPAPTARCASCAPRVMPASSAWC